MKYTEPGTYELTYAAIDECGNETTETRQVVVTEPVEEWITSFDMKNYTAPNDNPEPLLAPWYEPEIVEEIFEATGVTCTMKNGDVIPLDEFADAISPPWLDTYQDTAYVYICNPAESGDLGGIRLDVNGDTITSELSNLFYPTWRDIESINFETLVYKYKVEG